jgi:hypothetical protein
MFGLGKKKKFRTEALQQMFIWVPTLKERDLNLFGVLMKHQFDSLYDEGMTSGQAALTVGGLQFIQVVASAERADTKYFKYMTTYSGWLGACADHVLNNTDFLSDRSRETVNFALEKAKALYLPSNPEVTLGQLIENQKLMLSTIKRLIGAAPTPSSSVENAVS